MKADRLSGGRRALTPWRSSGMLSSQPRREATTTSKIFESGISMMSAGPNIWTLNIQPLGQFRPHRGFLLVRSTLLSSVARLLHTAA
jgi:hypothetical protein